jgi:hypothetical protein
MSGKRIHRQIGKGRAKTSPSEQPVIRNPELFPAFVYLSGLGADEKRLRGMKAFETLKTLGYRVDIDRPPGGMFTIRSPETVIFIGFTPFDDQGDWLRSLRSDPRVVLIMDCHFPISDTTEIVVEGPLEKHVAAVDAIPVALTNLALADAVTVPNGEWAADLTASNPDLNVFVLPDLTKSGDVDQFLLNFTEVLAAARPTAHKRWKVD